MNIYLCIKTHSVTGLKYLCKTTKDPFSYNGSGKDWLPHLRKYGYKHSTEVIKICENNNEFRFWGTYYSKLYNIVDGQDDYGNKIWANRIPETGGGGNQLTTPESKLKIATTNAKPEIILKRSEAMKAANQNPDTKENRRNANIKRFSDPLMRASVRSFGENNGSYDWTMYTFVHKTGIVEYCTRCQLRTKYTELKKGGLHKLVYNLRKTYKGWSIQS